MGTEFARATVTVTTFGEEFPRGLSGEYTLDDFPRVGTDTVLRWQESQQNFVISFAAPTSRLVDVTPTLTLPPGRPHIRHADVDITSVYSATTPEVLAAPVPTLLLAENRGGLVLLGLANLDGGLPGGGVRRGRREYREYGRGAGGAGGRLWAAGRWTAPSSTGCSPTRSGRR